MYLLNRISLLTIAFSFFTSLTWAQNIRLIDEVGVGLGVQFVADGLGPNLQFSAARDLYHWKKGCLQAGVYISIATSVPQDGTYIEEDSYIYRQMPQLYLSHDWMFFKGKLILRNAIAAGRSTLHVKGSIQDDRWGFDESYDHKESFFTVQHNHSLHFRIAKKSYLGLGMTIPITDRRLATPLGVNLQYHYRFR